jgi:hypothetical protein
MANATQKAEHGATHARMPVIGGIVAQISQASRQRPVTSPQAASQLQFAAFPLAVRTAPKIVTTVGMAEVVNHIASVLIVARWTRNNAPVDQILPSAFVTAGPIWPAPITIPSPQAFRIDPVHRIACDKPVKIDATQFPNGISIDPAAE